MGKLQLIIINSLLIIFFSTKVFAEGFKIDLRENNPLFQKQFDKFELNFDFKNNIATRVVKISEQYRHNINDFSEMKIVYNITNVDDNNIIFEISYKNYLKWAHKFYLDDDYLVGSKFYNKKYKKLVTQSGGLDSPMKRVIFNIDDLLVTEINNPLSKKPKSYTESIAYDPEAIEKKKDAEQFIKAAIFVVTVALIINHLDEINNIKEVNTATDKTKSFASNNQFNPKWAKPGYKFNSSPEGQKHIAEFLKWKFKRF